MYRSSRIYTIAKIEVCLHLDCAVAETKMSEHFYCMNTARHKDVYINVWYINGSHFKLSSSTASAMNVPC